MLSARAPTHGFGNRKWHPMPGRGRKLNTTPSLKPYGSDQPGSGQSA